MVFSRGAIFLLAIAFVQGQLLPGLPTLAPGSSAVRNCLKIKTNPDTGKKTNEILTNHGYAVSTLNVETEDGYSLQVFQITNSPKRTASTPVRTTPVFLNHGLLGNSIQWVSQNMGFNLATYLADQGYTVFIGNARGSSYSTFERSDGQKPSNIDVDGIEISNPTWWNFSFQEMGFYDVPAVIEKITEVSGSEKIFYVGHSMGGLEYYVMLSSRPQYNQRIKAGFMLAPAVYLNSSTSPLRAQTDIIEALDYNLFPKFGIPLTPTGVASTDCISTIEKLRAVDGFDTSQGDYYNIPKIGAAVPDFTSGKNMAHFGQMMNSGEFKQFDYDTSPLDGQGTNMDNYGTNTPPSFDMTQVTAPTYVYCGISDTLVKPTDCQRTYWATPGHVAPEWTPSFDHSDFAIAARAVDAVYSRILSQMNSYQ